MKYFYDVEDIMEILGVGETYAYKVIKILNKELEESGYLTVKGRVSAKYFNERYMIDDNDVDMGDNKYEESRNINKRKDRFRTISQDW